MVSATLRGYIGLGSNLGDRRANLQRAIELLAATSRLQVLGHSSIYESPAWGYESEHTYYNAVAAVEWEGPPLRLLEQCYRIEASLGRHRNGAQHRTGYHDRSIDLDIIWLDGMESDHERLMLPHPHAHQRAFVLKPLCELAPELVLRGQSVSWWLEQLAPENAAATVLVEDAAISIN